MDFPSRQLTAAALPEDGLLAVLLPHDDDEAHGRGEPSSSTHCVASTLELRGQLQRASAAAPHHQPHHTPWMSSSGDVFELGCSGGAGDPGCSGTVDSPLGDDTPEGTWLHSTYHNVTAMLGAGVLGLPYTFAALGWVGGLITLCGCLLVSLFTFTLLVHLHENGPTHRFSRYHELCEHAWGKHRGSWALLVFQIPFIFGLAVTYSVTGGESLGAFVALVRSGGTDSDCTTVLPLSAWIAMFSFVEILLAQLPNLDSLAWVSGVGAAMSIVYSVGASVLSLRSAEPRSEVDFTPGAGGGADSGPLLQQLMAMGSAITTIFFAYGGHNIALEIQATLPFPPTTVEPMMQGVYSAFTLTFVCYTLTASSGYYAFGSSAKANILQSSGSNPLWLLAGCHLGVMLHVLASYQVYSSPLLDLCNHWLTQLALRASPAPAAAAAYHPPPDHDRAPEHGTSGSRRSGASAGHFPVQGTCLAAAGGSEGEADMLRKDANARSMGAVAAAQAHPLPTHDHTEDTQAEPGPFTDATSSRLTPVGGPFSSALHSLGPSLRRFLLTFVYVAASCLLACLIPYFGSLMGLIGAIGAAPTNFVIPCLLWLKLREPKPWFSVVWWLCWGVVVMGSLVGVFGAIGSLYGIADSSNNYQR